MAKVFSLLVLFLASALCSPVPLVLWSGQRAFLDDHAEVAEVLKFQDIHNTFSKLVNPTTFSTRRSSALDSYVYQGYGHPEVLVAFVGATMGSSEFAMAEGGYSEKTSSLQNTLSSAQSTLVAPYVFSDGRISDDLVHTVAANPQSKIVTVHLSEGQGSTSGCSSLLAQLQENKNIFSNDVSDLVLVKFSSYNSQIGDCVKRVMDVVKSNTDNHLALLSADQPSTQVLMAFNTEEIAAAAPPKRLRRSFLQASSSDNSTYPGPQYITPTILWGLLLSFFLLFILWQALYCLLSIETPARFSYQYPVHSLAKEY
jgi:hypothetical protein